MESVFPSPDCLFKTPAMNPTDTMIEKTEALIQRLRALIHPIRLTIIFTLREKGELSAGELIDLLNQEQSLVSHHLQLLHKAGFVMQRRSGRRLFYQLNEPKLKEIEKWIDTMDE
jgi:DNA-binding transcriptional ArsR family regulator